MVLDKMVAILFQVEHHWKNEQGATIRIPNTFSIPAPTVVKNNTRQSLKIGFNLKAWLNCLAQCNGRIQRGKKMVNPIRKPG